jgi:hypothetical protein
MTAYAFVWVALMFYVWTVWRRRCASKAVDGARAESQEVSAGHFIFIPACIIVGMVVGWILGARGALTRILGFAAEERAAKK